MRAGCGPVAVSHGQEQTAPGGLDQPRRLVLRYSVTALLNRSARSKHAHGLPPESWMNIGRFRALHTAGATYAEIARVCGCDWRMTRKYLTEGSP